MAPKPSRIEDLVLNASEPFEIDTKSEIDVLGERGILMNKCEIANWQGDIPLAEYRIQVDENPEVINKKSKQVVQYVQELAVRYLRPPTPNPPGEIIIRQEANKLTPPAPPLVIRQQPARPLTPEPLVIREAPPQAPPAIGRKLITISGKRLPPPPRKVVIERLAPLPAKPQTVLIERWLPFAVPKRRVIFQAAPPDPIVIQPKNTIVQWATPDVSVSKEFKYLGVISANPSEYVQTYGAALKQTQDLPDFVLEIKNPGGLVLASEKNACLAPELEGDLDALNLIDLDKEGLSAYRKLLASSRANSAASKSSAAQLIRKLEHQRASSAIRQSRAASVKPATPAVSAVLVEEQAPQAVSRISPHLDVAQCKPGSRAVSNTLRPISNSSKLIE